MALPNVEPNHALIIRTNGEEVTLDTDNLQILKREINAKTVDFVRIGRLFQSDLCMIVNDQGYEYETVDRGNNTFENVPTKALLPVNLKATAYYHAICIPGTTYQIVGDVAIFHDR